MKKILYILFALVAFGIFGSCFETQYKDVVFQIKNNTDKTLHIALQPRGGRNTFYPKHLACLMDQGMYCCQEEDFDGQFRGRDSCVVRLNDENGEVLKVWHKKGHSVSRRKEFFRSSDWHLETEDKRFIYTLIINEEDLR